MKAKSLRRVLVLSWFLSGWIVVSSAEAKASEDIMTDADCNLAIAAALDDLEAWYERRTDWDGTTFRTFFIERVGRIQCSVESEGLRVNLYVEDSRFPGDSVRYLIDKRNRWIIERVFQR
jgi:hypothetical protein